MLHLSVAAATVRTAAFSSFKSARSKLLLKSCCNCRLTAATATSGQQLPSHAQLSTAPAHEKWFLKKPAEPRDPEGLHETYQETINWLKSKRLPDSADPRGVFANDEIDLSDIEVYGFDYDYTLAMYKTSVEELIHDIAKNIMVDELKYPEVVRHFTYDPASVIRGLHYDIEKGILMKIDNSSRIQLGTVYRGHEQLSDAEVLRLFKKRHLPLSVVESKGPHPKMVQLADTFSKPQISLLADVNQWFRQSGLDYIPEAIFNDVSLAVGRAHPFFHKAAATSPSELLDNSLNEDLRKLLHRFKMERKTIFLVTNSPFQIVNGGMCYMLGNDWQEYFDLIIIQAQKPSFFTEKSRVFREYSPKTDRLKWKPVDAFKPSKVYAGGTLQELQKLTGWEAESVLYFGDHVFADLADLSSHHGWRTGAVIQDLEEEMTKTNSNEFKWRVNWSTCLSNIIENNQCSAFREGDGSECSLILKGWKEELQVMRNELKTCLNPKFGSVFRTQRNPTYFSGRLLQFADIYMSNITNLNNYSLRHKFYPRRGVLPHDFKSWFV